MIRKSGSMLMIHLLLCGILPMVVSWKPTKAFFPFPHQSQAIGGRHLVDAGKALRKASNCFFNYDSTYYAYPTILREAGFSLAEAGDAWSQDHWEAVTYAMDDCSSSFVMLSQLQKTPALQKAYKGAAGELKAIASIQDPVAARENLIQLSMYFKEMTHAENMGEYRREGDQLKFGKYLKLASRSVHSLGREQKRKRHQPDVSGPSP